MEAHSVAVAFATSLIAATLSRVQIADAGGRRVFLFMHYPPYIHHPGERSSYDNIDEPGRSWMLAQMQRQGIEKVGEWARISLTVHSDLAAVGLTAAIAAALTSRGISANVVAGFYHDHVFVPWDRRGDAMAALRELSDV